MEYGRHLGQLHRRRRAHAPTSITSSHDDHAKINSWVFLSFLYEYGAPLGGPSGRRQPRSHALSSLPPLVVGRKTLVAAGHVTTQNLRGKKNSVGLEEWQNVLIVAVVNFVGLKILSSG